VKDVPGGWLVAVLGLILHYCAGLRIACCPACCCHACGACRAKLPSDFDLGSIKTAEALLKHPPILSSMLRCTCSA